MYGVGGCWLQGDIREHNADEMVGVSVRAQHCSDLYLDDEEFHQFKILDAIPVNFIYFPQKFFAAYGSFKPMPHAS